MSFLRFGWFSKARLDGQDDFFINLVLLSIKRCNSAATPEWGALQTGKNDPSRFRRSFETRASREVTIYLLYKESILC
jgi:hypothetical protein